MYHHNADKKALANIPRQGLLSLAGGSMRVLVRWLSPVTDDIGALDEALSHVQQSYGEGRLDRLTYLAIADRLLDERLERSA